MCTDLRFGAKLPPESSHLANANSNEGPGARRACLQ